MLCSFQTGSVSVQMYTNKEEALRECWDDACSEDVWIIDQGAGKLQGHFLLTFPHCARIKMCDQLRVRNLQADYVSSRGL